MISDLDFLKLHAKAALKQVAQSERVQSDFW